MGTMDSRVDTQHLIIDSISLTVRNQQKARARLVCLVVAAIPV